MKIYCAGPIRGDTKFQKSYFSIIKIVESLGQEPLTELSSNFEKSKNSLSIYERDITWLKNAHKLIAEVSGPSTGVGYEIAYALHKIQIPVLALYSTESKKISAMLLDNTSPLLTIQSYKNYEDLKLKIKEFI